MTPWNECKACERDDHDRCITADDITGAPCNCWAHGHYGLDTYPDDAPEDNDNYRADARQRAYEKYLGW